MAETMHSFATIFANTSLVAASWPMESPLEKRQQFSEEFNKVNILRKVPVLKDGDFVLEESHSSLPDTEIQHARLLVPSRHEETSPGGRIPCLAEWHHSGECLQNPLAQGQQVSPEKVHDAVEELNAAVQKLEDKFLQDKPFIVGSEISLADLVAVVELMQSVGAGCNIFEGRIKLQEWCKRVEITLGKELFMDAHSRILNPQELRDIVIDPSLKAQMKPMLLKMLK
ncbi:glutathione S-transferase theta-1-like isoform X2 [Candoia aspera]|uniref:glutathione S-transferase theta-1-like isoform X2 n=1 Tax=Candoia aspera TaxID=51853 RepID=UPI002FD807BA